MNSPVECLPLPVHYDHLSQSYWMEDEKKKWIKITETSAKRYLRQIGYKDPEDLENALLKIQRAQNVNYAGKLAGFDAGAYEVNETKILVTESPNTVTAKSGDWPLLARIFDGMLNVEPADQRPYFFGWLKRSYESFRIRKWTQAQAIAFAGPRNSAKSLVQALITEMLGGRSAKPFPFMTGKTNFNSDLFEGEHLMVEDESESIKYMARREFASHIKMVAVNPKHHCHGKFKNALLLTPWWRMTISLNDDPERLLVLPPITDDLADKIMLFKAAQKPMPMVTETAEEREAFWNALMAELPAFLDFLEKFEIPPELRSPRFGIIHYHHPDVLMALDETAPETQLLALIDKQIFGTHALDMDRWVDVPALEVDTNLTSNESKVCREARLLFTYPTACGTYLGRLEKNHPERVTRRTLEGKTLWTLLPPAERQSPSEVDSGGAVGPFCSSNTKKGESLMQKHDRNREGMENMPHRPTVCNHFSKIQPMTRSEEAEVKTA